MIPSSDNNNRTLREDEFADKVAKRIADSIKESDLNSFEGEVVIFLGFVDKNGNKRTKCIYGSQVTPSFKEKVCETAMDILLSDPDLRLFGNILDENFDI